MTFRGLLYLLLLSALPAFAQPAEFEVKYGGLLSEFVRDGKVDYAGLSSDFGRVEECIQSFADVSAREFDGWTVPRRLAYLINYYNCTVLSIVAKSYPITSIRKAGGWFGGDPYDWRVVQLFGRSTTLNILQRNYILRDYAEPGALLAICQGARGSPPLRGEPYTSDRLYDQIADQARIILQTPPNGIDRDRKGMYVPNVFRLYANDFARNSGSVEEYIRRISPKEWGLDEMGRFSVSYNKFDWRLNDAGQHDK